jgi:ribosomal protein L29
MEELLKKTNVELTKLLGEKRAALMKFRFEMSGGKVKNVKEGINLRREIARILTALKQVKA